MGAQHEHSTTDFDGLTDDYKRRLWIVIFINAAMFFVEISAGQISRSQALKADALDFLGDALTYGISLAVIGAPLATRAKTAMFKGFTLLVMGLWVFGSTIYQFFILKAPIAPVMGGVAILALLANLASVLILMRYQEGDANVRSVWLCSRNDAIGNIAVMLAAIGVWITHSAWPDLIVAIIMAGLFLSSAWQIFRRAKAELNSLRAG